MHDLATLIALNASAAAKQTVDDLCPTCGLTIAACDAAHTCPEATGQPAPKPQPPTTDRVENLCRMVARESDIGASLLRVVFGLVGRDRPDKGAAWTDAAQHNLSVLYHPDLSEDERAQVTEGLIARLRVRLDMNVRCAVRTALLEERARLSKKKTDAVVAAVSRLMRNELIRTYGHASILAGNDTLNRYAKKDA